MWKSLRMRRYITRNILKYTKRNIRIFLHQLLKLNWIKNKESNWWLKVVKYCNLCKTSTENIIWKQSIPVIFTVVFILINSVSETVFHSKEYSVWKKIAILKNTVAILKKWKKNYGQQYICKAYTIIMFVWNFHACITICTICPNFQTNISH